MLTYDVTVAVLFGLIFGSAINAAVWRIYVGRSWVKGRSECPDCGHVLKPKDLVPVISWLALGGKCRYCHAPIKDHPLVEITTAVMFGLSTYVVHPTTGAEWTKFAVWLVLLSLMIVLAVYDARWLILPDKIMVPLIVIALGYQLVLAILSGSWQVFLGDVASGVLAGGIFYAIVLFSQGRAMGGGDIKLAFAMGLILGPWGTITAMMLAFNVAAIIGIILILVRRKGRKDQISFGPFLVGGTVVAFLFGQDIVHWYLRVSGLS